MYCKELGKKFKSEKELFNALIKNEKIITDAKKSQILKSADKGLSIKAKQVLKGLNTQTIKALNLDENYYYIAVNSTNILDSHSDLHVKGIWNKTVKEQQGKVYLVADHKLELNNVIAQKEDIEMLLMDVPFSAIGKAYEGETQVLVYKIAKDKIKKDMQTWLDDYDIQASVRMQYVKIVTCLNSDEKDHEKYKKNYDTYLPLIANKSDFKTFPNYFWAITEAKNVRESSLVLFGSNHATGIVQDDKEKQEPSEDTHNHKTEAEKSLQDRKQFLLNI